MKNNNELEAKTCGQSNCACSSEVEKNLKPNQQNPNSEPANENQEKIEQDPTKFGDWQVNGRAIDF